jgi:hypothetical protein
VHVYVAGDAGAGGLPDIHAEVEALRPVERAEVRFGGAGELDHFGKGCGVRLLERRNVLVGHDHEVPARVRIKIQDDEIPGCAMDDEIRLIAILRDFFAEDAVARGLRAADIAIPPRAPDAVHGYCAGRLERRGLHGRGSLVGR